MDSHLTFSQEVKNELANHDWKVAEILPYLCGIFRLSFKEEGQLLTYSTQISSVATAVVNHLRKAFLCEAKIVKGTKSNFSTADVYKVVVSTKVEEIKQELEIGATFAKRYLSSKTIRPYLAGLFTSYGSISNPENGNYYLSISFKDEQEARSVAAKVKSYPDDRHMDFKVIARRNRYITYIKKSDQISNFLAFIGAPVSMLNYENVRLIRDFVNNEHRLDVCASVNYSRSLATGESNLADIKTIKEKIGLASQDERTMLLINLRMANIDASYLELSELATKQGYSISKSTVAHIFKSLFQLASRLRTGE